MEAIAESIKWLAGAVAFLAVILSAKTFAERPPIPPSDLTVRHKLDWGIEYPLEQILREWLKKVKQVD